MSVKSSKSDSQPELSKDKFRLALEIDITRDELESLCGHFCDAVNNCDSNRTEEGIAIKALKITRILRQSIDLKFEKRELSKTCNFVTNLKEPGVDRIKARLIRGMFMTFVEHQRGLPGLIEIISGVSSAGFGTGSFRMLNSEKKISLEQLKKYMPFSNELENAQIILIKDLISVDILSRFTNIRTGVYSLLAGCSLLPFYVACLKMVDESKQDNKYYLEKGAQEIKDRFSPGSERLLRFLSRNVFRVMFEELFNHEATVYSIFHYK